MGYHDIDDVKAETGQTYDANSLPTATKVNDLIANTDAVIDGYIKGRYNVPVTVADSPTAYKVLKRIALKMTVAEIEVIQKETTRRSTTEGDSDPINAKKAEALRYLRDIEKGILELTDATKGHTTGEVRYGTGTDTDENPPTPNW